MTSTLNCLSVLIKNRSSISTKILSAVLSFNPLSLAIKNPTPKNKLLAKCIEKTVRILLLNLIRYLLHWIVFHEAIVLNRCSGLIPLAHISKGSHSTYIALIKRKQNSLTTPPGKDRRLHLQLYKLPTQPKDKNSMEVPRRPRLLCRLLALQPTPICSL